MGAAAQEMCGAGASLYPTGRWEHPTIPTAGQEHNTIPAAGQCQEDSHTLHACWCSLCQPCSEPAHIQMCWQIPAAPFPISEGMRQPPEGEGAEVVASLLKRHHAPAAPSGSHLLLLVLPHPPAPNSDVFKHTSKVPGGLRGAPELQHVFFY